MDSLSSQSSGRSAPIRHVESVERKETAKSMKDAAPPGLPPGLTWPKSLGSQLTDKQSLFKISGAVVALTIAILLVEAAWHQKGQSTIGAVTLLVASLGLAFLSLRSLRNVGPKIEDTAPSRLTLEALIQNINIIDEQNDESINNFQDITESIITLFMESLPKAAHNKDNKNLLIKEILSNQEQLKELNCPDNKGSQLAGQGLDHVRSLIRNRLSNFKLAMETIELNIHDDKNDIIRTFFPDKDPDSDQLNLVKTTQVQGETHNGGLKPSFIELSVGDDTVKLVYKPRSIEVDSLICSERDSLFSTINDLASSATSNQSSSSKADANEQVKKKILPTFTHLPKKEYGYVKFLSHSDTDYQLTRQQMKEYYHIIGAIQAISQIFGIGDLHQDNVICHAQQPHLIDLEVAFNIEILMGKEQTGLADAALIFTDFQTSEATNNKVVLLDEANQEVPQAVAYISDIEEGFNQMKSLVQDNQDALINFLQNVPDGLPLRHVLVPTQELESSINFVQFDMRSKNICDLVGRKLYDKRIIAPLYDFEVSDNELGERLRIELKNSSAAFTDNLINDLIKKDLTLRLEPTIEKDCAHGDIPIFRTNPQGQLFCGEILLATAKSSARELIKDRISNAGNINMHAFKRDIQSSSSGPSNPTSESSSSSEGSEPT